VDTLPQSVVEAIAFNKLLKENLAAKFSFCFFSTKKYLTFPFHNNLFLHYYVINPIKDGHPRKANLNGH
jgi:hypothetical protein